MLQQGADGAADAAEAEARARSFLMFRPSEQRSGAHAVRRSGFTLTHASYLTSTLSQGQTLRKGVTIDCARDEDAGRAGMSDEMWRLHLYVMFSRATCMRNMLILWPPAREFLERGPQASLRKALQEFEKRAVDSRAEAEQLAAELGFVLPPA